MSGTIALVIVAGVWLSTGVVLAVAMGRRGHAPFTWLVLGGALGPLAIPMALQATRDESSTSGRQIRAGAPGAGPLRVLVGVDGSEEAREALRTVIRILGPRLGTLTLASVIDYDTARSELPWDERDQALTELEWCAQLADGTDCPSPETVLLAGVPSEALVEHAREHGHDMLVIGTRGRGASKLVLGSVASRLARTAEVPVLLVSGPAPAAREQ